MVISLNKSVYLYFSAFHILPGWIGLCGNDQGLRRVVLIEETKEAILDKLFQSFSSKYQVIENTDRYAELSEKIAKYFQGEKQSFRDQKINLSDYTDFQQKVLKKTREIPYGETRTYRWLAEETGHPYAYRAAGGVMRINPLPLIIPCHRVLGSQGSLTGFSATGGLKLKRNMLEMEKAI